MSEWEKTALAEIDEIYTRQSRVINRAYVKQWALEYAKDKRPFWSATRVSENFLNAVETATKAFIRDRIDRHPTKGKTLQ